MKRIMRAMYIYTSLIDPVKIGMIVFKFTSIFAYFTSVLAASIFHKVELVLVLILHNVTITYDSFLSNTMHFPYIIIKVAAFTWNFFSSSGSFSTYHKFALTRALIVSTTIIA